MFVEIIYRKSKYIRREIQENLISITCYEINEGNCDSSRSDVVCTNDFSEFSVLDIAGVYEIFVEVNK